MLLWLTVAIVIICALFLLLMVGMVLARVIVDWRRRRTRRLSSAIAPRIARVERGELAAAGFAESLEGGEKALSQELLLSSIAGSDPAAAQALRRAYHAAGHFARDVEELEGRRWWQRAAAAERLGTTRDPEALPYLVEAMQDEEAEVRFRAANALGNIGVPQAIAPLVRALDEPSRWSSIRIADILANMGPGVDDELIATFPELSSASKPLVLDILAKAGARDRVDWVRTLLDYEDANVRARACHALGILGDAGDAGRLMARLDDSAWPVRALAAKSLGRLGIADAAPILGTALRDREWWVRANSAEALRELGPRGLETLESMLVDDDTFASHQAVLVLEKEGLLEERLEGLLSADEPERQRAERLLELLLRLERTALLEHLRVSHESGALREIIGATLEAEALAARGAGGPQA